MAEIFVEPHQALSDVYLEQLLKRTDFWAMAAFFDRQIIGGLTAHILPMTRNESAEILIYDIAVLPVYQRRGAGRTLINTLCASAAAEGIDTVLVGADSGDARAMSFYQALGGVATAVTHFVFTHARS